MNSPLYLTLIVTALLLSVVYRKRIRAVLSTPSTDRLKHHKLLFISFAITLIPLVVMNLFFTSRDIDTPEQAVYIGGKYKDNRLYLSGLKNISQRDSTDFRKHIEYIHEFSRINPDSECYKLSSFYEYTQTFEHQLAFEYAEYYCKGLEMNIAFMNSHSDTLPYINFMKAIYHLQNQNIEKVAHFLLLESSVNPTFDLNNIMIYQLYKESNSDSLQQFMLDYSKSKYLPYSIQNDYHFLHGNWDLYFRNLLSSRLANVGFLTFIAAFLVSFIWVVFLRLMDVYRRERWRDIIIVFLLGALFTFACFPLYDYADLIANWQITGNSLDDFLYCTIVIGGSEELVKLIPWLIFGIVTRKLKEPFDYILYASVAALGFAFVENLMYLENYHNIVVRSIMSTVGHMFDATIIAYAFIIARFRMSKNSPWKWLVIVIGFIVAMLAHGFYDYWLISPAAKGYQLITVLFFIGSLSVWFFFKNNAMNHSPYFAGNQKFRIDFQQDILTLSMLAVLMLEFILISYEIGVEYAQTRFYSSAVYVGAFCLFISSELDNFSLEKGVWRRISFAHRFRFSGVKRFLRFISHHGYDSVESLPEGKDLTGLSLRLFAPKSNMYVGNKLPVSGVCVRKIKVGGNPNWYVFQLNTPIEYLDYVSDRIIIKNKQLTDSLMDDKIEIYFMFVPHENVFRQHIISIEDLRYVGRVYSRPLSKS